MAYQRYTLAEHEAWKAAREAERVESERQAQFRGLVAHHRELLELAGDILLLVMPPRVGNIRGFQYRTRAEQMPVLETVYRLRNQGLLLHLQHDEFPERAGQHRELLLSHPSRWRDVARMGGAARDPGTGSVQKRSGCASGTSCTTCWWPKACALPRTEGCGWSNSENFRVAPPN